MKKKEKEKEHGFASKIITRLDLKMFGSTKGFASHWCSVMGYGITAGIITGIAVLGGQALDMNENLLVAITILLTLITIAFVIKKLLSNIKLFDSIGKKILYVALNVITVLITILFGVYMLLFVVVGYILYFLLLAFSRR